MTDEPHLKPEYQAGEVVVYDGLGWTVQTVLGHALLLISNERWESRWALDAKVGR